MRAVRQKGPRNGLHSAAEGEKEPIGRSERSGGAVIKHRARHVLAPAEIKTGENQRKREGRKTPQSRRIRKRGQRRKYWALLLGKKRKGRKRSTSALRLLKNGSTYSWARMLSPPAHGPPKKEEGPQV